MNICLAAFAVLSLENAVSDYSLSKKTAKHTTQYYEAVNNVQEQLAKKNQELREKAETKTTEAKSSQKKAEIKTAMEQLHTAGMLSGDPHKGNFIVSPSGVRIIDLSGKRCNAQRMAQDRMAMARHLGIENEIKDIGYYTVIYKNKLRNFIKRLKGKKTK